MKNHQQSGIIPYWDYIINNDDLIVFSMDLIGISLTMGIIQNGENKYHNGITLCEEYPLHLDLLKDPKEKNKTLSL